METVVISSSATLYTAQYRRILFSLIVTLITSFCSAGCVVKEELDDTYNQAHLGLNQWSLFQSDEGAYVLNFDVGYLIGLIDDNGVGVIDWTFELVNRDREILGYQQEEMRDATPDKTAIFVEGRRTRTIDLVTLLEEGDTYILWFTLRYNDDILHEQLFPLIAGENGGDPNWINELIDDNANDLSSNVNNADTGETEDPLEAEVSTEVEGEEAEDEDLDMTMTDEDAPSTP